MKWYKRDPNAYYGGTRTLTPEQRGIYNDIIELSYMRDGNLPDDDRFMARACVVRPQMWRRIKSQLIVVGKIKIVEGKIIANRVETVLKEAQNSFETVSKLRVLGVVSEPELGEINDLAGIRARDRARAPDPDPDKKVETSSFPTALREAEKRKKVRKKKPKPNGSGGELASALPTGALARPPRIRASPSLEEIVKAKGWVKAQGDDR